MLRKVILAAAFVALTAAGAAAQDTQAGVGAAGAATEAPGLTNEGWHFLIAPYLWGINTSGEVTLGPLSADFDVPLKTALKQLDAAIEFRGEIRKNRLGMATDYTYMKLSKDGAFSLPLPDGSLSVGDLNLRIELWELWPYYRLGNEKNAFDLFAGIRYYSFRNGIDFRERSASRQFNWTDPLVGARWVGQVKPKLALTARADFAGFGAGSQLTLNLQGGLRWQFSRVAGLVVQYRWMDIDYEKGELERADSFKFDSSMHGGLVGVAFAW